ncbi:uncharacterized protein SAPINGB_P003658 [Magnusiomyces paraingens]|uniref:Cytochrome b mRNA-processing protein 4 n=1 Tax=Magnusiomyces paraingens TaxID=2606893 RepID=A0A5E8BXX9_9ASCO|nr:uncharacterized protein SAPINGB_P003658 [Saprochaete ingens]VVT53605.1 unnamed protein product [Saprochaete ingens]
MGWARWIKTILAGGSVVGLGVSCFIFTTPTDEELIAKLSPELRQQYYDERERRRMVSQWAVGEARKTAASSNPIWMTGEIPSGLVRGEDGQGRRVSPAEAEAVQRELAQDPDAARAYAEGLQYAPPSLIKQKDSWAAKQHMEKQRAIEEEKQRLRVLAEKESKA